MLGALTSRLRTIPHVPFRSRTYLPPGRRSDGSARARVGGTSSQVRKGGRTYWTGSLTCGFVSHDRLSGDPGTAYSPHWITHGLRDWVDDQGSDLGYLQSGVADKKSHKPIRRAHVDSRVSPAQRHDHVDSGKSDTASDLRFRRPRGGFRAREIPVSLIPQVMKGTFPSLHFFPTSIRIEL